LSNNLVLSNQKTALLKNTQIVIQKGSKSPLRRPDSPKNHVLTAIQDIPNLLTSKFAQKTPRKSPPLRLSA
jgi:hypothetical protein